MSHLVHNEQMKLAAAFFNTKPRQTTASAIRRLFIQLLNNLRNPGNAAMRQEETWLPLSSITIVAARWSCRRFPVIKTFHVTSSLSSRRP
jgi:hypothetical protein